MKKFIFSSIMLCLTFQLSMAAEKPFVKKRNDSQTTKHVEARKKQLMPVLQLAAANQRISNVTPDSVTLYEYNNGNWDLAFTAKLTYHTSGAISGLLLYLPPPLSLPIGNYVITYNAAGKLTSLQQNIFLPTPSVEFKIEQRYDANQNLVSVRYFENMNGSLVLSSGDSATYTYSGGALVGVETSYYDDFLSSWQKSSRYTNMQFNAQSHVTGVRMQFWDDFSNQWSTEILQYSGVEWGLGFPGLNYLTGIEEIKASDLFAIQIVPDYLPVTSPTAYMEVAVIGTVLDTLSRASSTITSGRVSRITTETYTSGSWLQDYRSNYTYDANNRIVMVVEQGYNGLTWEDDYKYEWTFNAQNSLTKQEEWFNNGTSLQIGYGQAYEYLYMANNFPFQIIDKYYDSFLMSYVNSEKRVYNFGSFNTGVAELKASSLEVYPNPVQDVLKVRFKSETTGMATLKVLNVQGQAVYMQEIAVFDGENTTQIPFQEMTAGIYLLKVETAGKSQVIRIVK
ncbi:MAG: T9SS type A sorting domain-containing protein [Sphingobacteriaceae bacterium]|nr:T9SS type A sorting domain-containing protein [Sphingobacteriaceae bacterium]